VAPPRQLAGFAKVSLAAGQHRRVLVALAPRAFAHWDTATQRWLVNRGSYPVSVGTSSRDLPLTAPVRRSGGAVS
jgi:beta-glucosidase